MWAEQTRREAAQAYKNGWCLIPLKENSKEPATAWRQFASRKPTREEYAAFKFGNYGIVTGEVSGIIVLDIDVPDGLETLAKYDIHAVDYFTPKVITPTGGMHLYFNYDYRVNRNGVGIIGPGVDLRSDGGYVVGPGSCVDGSYYEWHTTGDELDDVPDWLLPGSPLLRGLDNRANGATPMLNEPIHEGGRNNAMAGLAGALVGRQVPPNVVLETMLYLNQHMFVPPLPEEEVMATFNSIERRREVE